MSKLKNLTTFSLLFFLSIQLLAETGRLEDGRAYRIDDQGYQLVDYVAELELKIEELQTELVALSNELRITDQESADFAEKNISTKQVEELTSAQTEASSCKDELISTRKELAVNTNQQESWSIKNKQLAERNQQLADELEEQKQLLLVDASKDNQGQEKIALLQSSLESVRRQLDAKNLQIDNLQLQREQDIAKLSEKSRTILALDTQLQELENKNKLAAASYQLQLAQNKQIAEDLAKTKIALKEQAAKQASIEVVSQEEPASEVAPTRTAVYATGSAKRQKAFTHLQDKLFTDLKKLKTLISERAKHNTKYQRIKNQQNVQVSLNPLRTKSGLDLSDLQAQLSQARKFSDLGKVQKNTYELSRNVRSDIAVLQRMTR